MVKLTKKFENEGLVGQDPAKGLQRALDRQGANVGPTILVLWAPVRDFSPFYIWTAEIQTGSRILAPKCLSCLVA